MAPYQNLFRSFREGNKIFVLQKQRNGKGWFVTITTLGESKSKGYVIIPEGRDACGWHGLSREINGLMAVTTAGNRDVNHRRPDQRTHQLVNKNTAGDRGSFAAMVSGQGRVHVEGNGKGRRKFRGKGKKLRRIYSQINVDSQYGKVGYWAYFKGFRDSQPLFEHSNWLWTGWGLVHKTYKSRWPNRGFGLGPN
jgi:hypothetical protein